MGCYYCKKEILENSKYCNYCGKECITAEQQIIRAKYQLEHNRLLWDKMDEIGRVKFIKSVDLDKSKNSKVEKYLREIGKEIEEIKSIRFKELISDFTQDDIDELAKLYYFDGTPCGQNICTTCTPSKL